MADRVHPSPDSHLPSPPAATEEALLHPAFNRPPAPAPGTYVIQIPKDQVLRVPPPGHARRYKKLRARPARRRALRRACLGACCAALLLLLLAAAFVGVVYLVFRPRAPLFSISSLSIQGLDALSAPTASSPLSPDLHAGVRADNSRNHKVGIDYRRGGEVTISYSDAPLAAGEWPAFYQPPSNVTLFLTALRGNGVTLTDDFRKRLVSEQAAGAVPLTVDVRVPVRVRLGKMTTWTVNVKTRCDVTVDKLTATATATSRGCKVKVKVLWWWW